MKYDLLISLKDDGSGTKDLLFKSVDFKKDFGVFSLFYDEEADTFGSPHNSFGRTFFSIEEKRITCVTFKLSEKSEDKK